MTDDFNTENDEKANKIVELLLNGSKNKLKDKLKDVIKNKQEKKQLSLILKKVVLSKDKVEIKKNIRILIENLNKFGITFHNNNLFEDKSRGRTPIFWSNATDSGLLNRKKYDSDAYHYYYSDSKIMMVLWDIIENIVKYQDQLKIDGTYCQEMFKLGKRIDVDNISHIPYGRLLSEIWVETMPLDDLLNKELVIEFGQNSLLFDENRVFSSTDSVMSVSELPILLDRIAKHNLDIDLGAIVGEKIYLEKTGISEKQINDGIKEDIRNNGDRGFIVVKKVERGLGGYISKEYVRVPIELRYLILKLEKRRLKKIIEELEKTTKEATMNRDALLTEAAKENSTIYSSFNGEEQQHNFIERARQKQEKNYLMNKYFMKKEEKIQGKNEHPLKNLLDEKRNILKATETNRNKTYENLLIRQEKALENPLTKILKPIKRMVKNYIKKYRFLRNLVEGLKKIVNKLEFFSDYKNEGVDEALINKLKELNGTDEELLERANEEFKLLSITTKMEVLDKLNKSNNEIGKKTGIIIDASEINT